MIVGIGIDLAEVERYRFDERALAWFSRKVYTEEEMAYAMRKRHWPERLAGFFAAKEATRKAFGHAIPWRLVGVSHERSGKPIIRLYGDAELADRAPRRDRRSSDDHPFGNDRRRRGHFGIMIDVLTAQEMRAADAQAGAASSETALMRNAGDAIAAFLERAAGGRIVAFAGPGNNGGDAYAALAQLHSAASTRDLRNARCRRITGAHRRDRTRARGGRRVCPASAR